MIKFNVNGKTYEVSFRYRTSKGKRADLKPKHGIVGEAICGIVAYRDGTLTTESPGERFQALGSAICTARDQWCYATGRRKAFQDAVRKCGLLRTDSDGLLAAFFERFPRRVPVKRTRITEEERDARYAAGADLRERRAWAKADDGGTRTRTA